MADIEHYIWREKYRLVDPDGEPVDKTTSDTHKRVHDALFPDSRDQIVLDEMLARRLLMGGRIVAGAGSGRDVTLFNCYVSPTIEDSMVTELGGHSRGILDSLSVAAVTQQMGGGIGMDFSTIRPENALVSRKGTPASGPLPFMDMWDSMCLTIMSSGTRRGAMMGTMRCDHPDIEAFVEAKQTTGRLTNFNVSVLVTDKFMAAVRNNDSWDLGFGVQPFEGGENLGDDQESWYVYKTVSARELWDNIIRSTYVYAEPGVIFIDRVNQMNNLGYCENICATNPCFTGDTLVWTAHGPRRLDKLARSGETVPVLTQLNNGQLAYRDMENPRLTRQLSELVEVVLRGSGRKARSITRVRCTPNHKFHLRDGRTVSASELQNGDSVHSAYRYRANQKGYIRLSGSHDSPLEHHVAVEYVEGRRPIPKEEHAHHKNEVKWDNDPKNIEILRATKHNAQHMTGERNPMRRFPEKNPFSQPGFSEGRNNGRYRQDICDEELLEMRDSGLSYQKIADKVGCCKATVQKRLSRNHKVVEVVTLKDLEDVYCGTVPSTGRFFVVCGKNEGVLVSNCGEQPLPPYGNCNLASVNLAMFVTDPFLAEAEIDTTALRRTVRAGIRALDRVIDVSLYPTKEQEEEGKQKRRTGLGITGFANMLQMLGARYGSREAKFICNEVGTIVRDESYRESIKLARAEGSFPALDKKRFLESKFVESLPPDIVRSIAKHGIRNGLLNTIAPTGTTSLFAGNVSSGLEPTFAHSYERKILNPDGSHTTMNVEDYGYKKFREVHGEDVDLPDYMVTAQELTVDDHLSMQGAWQRYIDSSISKTINVPTEFSFEEFAEVYDKAYDMGLKGCTTYRPDPSSGRGSVLSVEGDNSEENIVPRPEQLVGTTYKIRWQPVNSAFYITICDHEDRPFEIFINSKSVEHQEWITALTRTISAIFRKGGSIDFLVEELEQVHSPVGGQWSDGKYVPSLVAMIGGVLRRHLGQERESAEVSGERCPRCQQPTVIRSEGCLTCTSCGHSKCG